jgi:hypothetical protein
MDERRHSRRVAPANEVCVCIGGNRPARLIDITPDGAHLELATALNPNQQCQISLALSDGTVRVKARIVHCKLTGYTSFGSGGQLVYRAGVEFLEMDDNLATKIGLEFAPPFKTPARRGPIKVKVNVEALEHAAEALKHGTN